MFIYYSIYLFITFFKEAVNHSHIYRVTNEYIELLITFDGKEI